MTNRMKLQITLFTLLLLAILSLVSCMCATEPNETMTTLSNLDPPASDWIELKEAYQGITATLAPPTAPRTYEIGDQETFWVMRDAATGKPEQVSLTLRYVNEVVYMWVEPGVTWLYDEPITDAELKELGDLFADKVYPTTRAVFGSEPNPGLDNDPRLHILHARIDNAGGYYNDDDMLPVEIYAYSNMREMIYVNAPSYLSNAENYYVSMLTHEFTHMIHVNQDLTAEPPWIVEGLALLSEELNGYPSWLAGEFASNPDVQLNAHRRYPQDEWTAHYGADQEFFSYLHSRFGSDFIRDVVVSDARGIRTMQEALDKHAPGVTFEDVFADWTVDYFLRRNPGKSLTQYTIPVTRFDTYPQSDDQTVHQYAADYYVLLPFDQQDVTFEFDGQVSVPVLPTQAHSGKYLWWAGRLGGDISLTRQVDLSQVQQATLNFSTWYDLYDHFGYSYVSVSTDNGKTWETQEGMHTTYENPNDKNLGSGFTCKSDIGCDAEDEPPNWVDESIDLSPYAGEVILLRFHYLGGSISGFAIDDIEIPEINFKDDAESDVGGVGSGRFCSHRQPVATKVHRAGHRVWPNSANRTDGTE